MSLLDLQALETPGDSHGGDGHGRDHSGLSLLLCGGSDSCLSLLIC
jgi:hypothetical protein